MDQKKSFHYLYSAKQQEEIGRIRNKYVEPKENKMEMLCRLDRNVTRKATVASMTVGLVGSLILGIGMCCSMVWMDRWFVLGILLGVIGIAIAAAAYPLYRGILQRERKKIAPEIIRLTDELMKSC